MDEEKKAAEAQELDNIPTETEASEGNNFSEEEREGFYVVRAICESEIDPSRLSEKDKKNYCNILIDGNTWESILRMHFNGLTKLLEIFDEKEPKILQVERISGIYQHGDRIRSALKSKLG